jgi:hypothetical protein
VTSVNEKRDEGREIVITVEPSCSCPDVDVTNFGDMARMERVFTTGYADDCRIHGLDGTNPIYRRVHLGARESWSLPAEPRSHVTRLRDCDGEMWERVDGGWHFVDSPDADSWVPWADVMVYAPLTDVSEGEPE